MSSDSDGLSWGIMDLSLISFAPDSLQPLPATGVKKLKEPWPLQAMLVTGN